MEWLQFLLLFYGWESGGAEKLNDLPKLIHLVNNGDRLTSHWEPLTSTTGAWCLLKLERRFSWKWRGAVRRMRAGGRGWTHQTSIKIKFLRDDVGTLTLEMENSKGHQFGWPHLWFFISSFTILRTLARLYIQPYSSPCFCVWLTPIVTYMQFPRPFLVLETI